MYMPEKKTCSKTPVKLHDCIYLLSTPHKHFCVSFVTFDADEEKQDGKIHRDNLLMMIV